MKSARVLLAVALLIAPLALPGGAGSGVRSASSTGQSAIFYYPWYSTPVRDGRWAHWYVEREGTPVLSTRYYPSRGLYSSSNVKIVAAQMREIAAAGITTVVVSWWGQDPPRTIASRSSCAGGRTHGLEVAIHLEPYHGRSPARGGGHRATLAHRDLRLLRVRRRPRSCSGVGGSPFRARGVRTFGHTTLWDARKRRGSTASTRTTSSPGPAPRSAASAHRLTSPASCAPSVGPGYDARLATSDRVVRPRLHGQKYDRMWKTALGAEADLVTITSYNEWQEGTQIEPAQVQADRPGYDGAWGRTGMAARRAYLDATAGWTAKLREISRQ